MSYVQETLLRRENIKMAVESVLGIEFVLQDLCDVDNSSAFTESYYREDATELVGGTGSNIKGVPRLSPLPNLKGSWTKYSGVNLKYGGEDLISIEDQLMDNIPVVQRTIFKISRAIKNGVDIAIEALMSASYGNTYAISAGNEWNSATVANRDPVFDMLQVMELVRADGIDPFNGGVFVVNGTDYNYIISNSKVMNNPSFKASDVVANGKVAQLVNSEIRVSENIPADVAYFVMNKQALVWKNVKALTVDNTYIPQNMANLIQGYLIGHAQLVQPNAVVKITNTRA
jgi:hypothetical protein